MAVPKKKPSKTRQRQRHSAWQAEFKLESLVECANCGEMQRSHRACTHCGQYRGRQVMEKPTVIRKVPEKSS